jgi:triosephosphate isomerase
MKTLLIGNWKMHPEAPEDALALLAVTKKVAQKTKKVSVVLMPPTLFLCDLVKRTRIKLVQFGVQNVHWEKEGAFTGETSAPQARAAGAAYVLVGHAERRKLGETNEDVGRKVAAVLAAGVMKAVICIGEQTRNDDGLFLTELAEQIKAATVSVAPEQLTRIVIAYEPVWAVGAAQPMSSHEMHETSMYIRKLLIRRFGEAAFKVPILYGGSISAETAGEMLQMGEVQGLLVGRASVGEIQWENLIRASNDAS